MHHGHMGHGDMDMGDGEQMMCSMNVRSRTSLLQPSARYLPEDVLR